MPIERTLSIIKPDATRRNLTGEIAARLEQAGLRIVAQKRMRLSVGDAEAFYNVHKERPFFRSLVEFMSSGPVVVQVLEGEGLTCDEEIQEELEKFPKDLTGWYLRSLQQLSARSAQQQELARLVGSGALTRCLLTKGRKIFWLLVTAKQPLRLSEIRKMLH